MSFPVLSGMMPSFRLWGRRRGVAVSDDARLNVMSGVLGGSHGVA